MASIVEVLDQRLKIHFCNVYARIYVDPHQGLIHTLTLQLLSMYSM